MTDPESPYVNGDPTIGRQGSIPPAAVFEHPQREIINVIDKSRITPSDADLLQLAKAVRSQRMNYVEDTGTANMLQVALDPPITTPYTPGLVLHVFVRNSNTGPCRINAGFGFVPIRRMSGLELSENELPQHAVATLVFDGTVFQLSNFGGGGEPQEVHFQSVKIPYTVDKADWDADPATRNTVIAEFSPPLDQVSAGEAIAVKISNTNTGPTQIRIDSQGLFNLAPNGGGMMLQGDLHEGDVVIFFFDGTNFCFAPNPEIDAHVIYSVGFGRQFTTLNEGMTAIRRKFIGTNGYIVFQLCTTAENNGQPFYGPLIVNHPSGDRILVQGTMLAAAPLPGQFQRSGRSVAQRHNDAINNLFMLRTRYGTEVRMPNGNPGMPYGSSSDIGLMNTGAGIPTFAHLLVTGHELPMQPGYHGWNQTGVTVNQQLSMSCVNVTVWGCQVGFNSSGGLSLHGCYALWNSHVGFHFGSGAGWCNECHAFGNQNYGWAVTHSQAFIHLCSAQMNETFGIISMNGSAAIAWWSSALGNGTDYAASNGSSLTIVHWPGVNSWGPTSPVVNVTGNNNSIIATVQGMPQWMI